MTGEEVIIMFIIFIILMDCFYQQKIFRFIFRVKDYETKEVRK